MAQNIDQVIEELDVVVAWAIENGKPAGLFAAMYRQVTLRVRDGIANGDFDDGPRMDRFDTVFAGRYLEALRQHGRGERCSSAWDVSFNASSRVRPMQHLLLGMGAHIGLDLPIAAAQVGGADTEALGRDFERINDILFSLIDGMQEVLDNHSLWMAGLDKLGGRVDEWVAAKAMERMRIKAWKRAVDLSRLQGGGLRVARRMLDLQVASTGRLIRRPIPGLPRIPMKEPDLRALIAELDQVAQSQ
ncbi:MAG: hypothetical protein ACI9VR_000763 [Cognaticolwellia sp.]|jgi:hypothetical protein